MEDFISLIGSVGFPIAVTAYTLITLNTTVKSMTESMNKLTSLVQRVLDKVGGGDN